MGLGLGLGLGLGARHAVAGEAVHEGADTLYLAHISPISRPCLPDISPISRPYLPYISP